MRHLSFSYAEVVTLVEGICGLVSDKPVDIYLTKIEGSKASFQSFKQIRLECHSSIYVSMEGLESVDVVVEINRDKEYIHIASAGTGFHTNESTIEVEYDLEKNLVVLLSRPTAEMTIVAAIQF